MNTETHTCSCPQTHTQSLCNLTELKHFNREECNKLTVSRYAILIETYPHRLSAMIEATEASI